MLFLPPWILKLSDFVPYFSFCLKFARFFEIKILLTVLTCENKEQEFVSNKIPKRKLHNVIKVRKPRLYFQKILIRFLKTNFRLLKRLKIKKLITMWSKKKV